MTHTTCRSHPLSSWARRRLGLTILVWVVALLPTAMFAEVGLAVAAGGAPGSLPAQEGPCGPNPCAPPSNVGPCGPDPCVQTANADGPCGPTPCAPPSDEGPCGPEPCRAPADAATDGPCGATPCAPPSKDGPCGPNPCVGPASEPCGGVPCPPPPGSSSGPAGTTSTNAPAEPGTSVSSSPALSDPEAAAKPTDEQEPSDGGVVRLTEAARDSWVGPIVLGLVGVSGAAAGLVIVLRRRSSGPQRN